MNWVKQYSDTTSEELLSVYFTDSLTGYAVGSYGTILRLTNGGVWVVMNLALRILE